MNKFLGTFASQSGTGVYMSKGVNDENLVCIQYELTSALTAAQTVTLTLPAGVDDTMVPVYMAVWSNADPRLWEPIADIAITSHDKDTGETVITAAGNVADNSTIFLMYAKVGLGT
jgi:hypothetical protein